MNLEINSVKEKEIAIATKYPNICKISPNDNVLEFYCDNQILSSLRSCQGYFVEAFINNLKRKSVQLSDGSSDSSSSSQDNLDIGIWFHSIMEAVDKALLNNNALSVTEALFIAKDLWIKNNIEQYRESPGYKSIGGMVGAMELVKDYMVFFNPSQSNLRIITTELAFGYNKEAPIVDPLVSASADKTISEATYNYRAYLVGTPDGVIESALGIGPKDYKTTSRIDMVRDSYKPSEQLTGYVYAINKIFSSGLEHTGKKCNTAYLIAVSKKPTKDPKNRILKVPYTYSDADLEAYRKRQIATFDRLYELLVLEAQPYWNTMMCNNFYFRQCPFHTLHAGLTEQYEMNVEAFYEHKEPWHPRTRGRVQSSPETEE